MADPSLLASAREKLQQMDCRPVDGTYLIGWSLFHDFPGHVRSIKHFDLQAGDILLCGFPRSGNHWMFEIIHMILDDQHGYTDRIFGNMVCDVMPDADNVVKTLETPRVFATHLKPNFIPKAVLEKNIKIVYVFRNPKDVIASFFKITTNLAEVPSFEGSWEEYFELQLTGEYCWGSWFDHLKQWNAYIEEHPQNIFTSQFEKLRENPQAVIADLCHFFGKSESLAEDIADATSFDKMKAATKEKQRIENEQYVSNEQSLAMVKGKVKAWKSKFTVEQNERFNEIFNLVSQGNGLMERVKPYIV